MAGRISRKQTARNVIAAWRVMWKMPGAPRFEANASTIHRAVSGRDDYDHGPTQSYINTMIALGLVDRKSATKTDRPANIGAWYSFSLLVDVEAGVDAIARHFANGGNLIRPEKSSRTTIKKPALTTEQQEQVAIRMSETDTEQPVEAVVGPDAPSPFESLRELRRNEPAALVEAARQYAHRQDFVLERLVEIEKLGVEIDRTKVMQAIHLQRDDEFEGIVKVLPYIEELESRIRQQEGWRDEMIAARNELREARAEKNRVAEDLRKQTDANRRLAEKMAQDAVKRGTPTVLVG